MPTRPPRLPVYKKSVRRSVQKKKDKRDPYDSLQGIAGMLNRMRRDHPPGMQQWVRAWKKAEGIIEAITGDVPEAEKGNTILTARNLAPSLEWAMSDYNRTFNHVPVRLVIATDRAGTRPFPTIQPMGKEPDPMALIGIRLWFDYFHNAERERLKRCWQCHAWFVDRSKNRGKRFCTSGHKGCSGKWWSRPIRRERLKTKAKSDDQKGKNRTPPPITREEAIELLTRVKKIAERRKRR